MQKYQKVLSILKICGLLVAPIVLLILPADFFDNGTPICISRSVFDFECYACGMTRAVMHMIHFEFEEAWNFNKLTFVVVPVLIFAWFYELNNERLFWKNQKTESEKV